MLTFNALTKLALCEQIALKMEKLLSPMFFFLPTLVLNKIFVLYMMSLVFGKLLKVSGVNSLI